MKLLKALPIVGLTLMLSSVAQGAPVVIKFATIAPEGSAWMKILKSAATEIKTKTKDNVVFKLYPGGIAGDEPDVLRKMRVGQYHGGGFASKGLGEFVPEVRVMELPLFFHNLAEVDYVREKLTPELEAKFLAKQQVFLGWAEPGLVYVYAQKPIYGAADLKSIKMWAWEGDPLATAMLQAFKVTPVNIALPDVLMALQTGMITGIYGPPMAAMAFQWHTKVKSMMSDPLANSTGGVLVSKRLWDRISAADQSTVKTVITAALHKLNLTTRKQNDEAIAKFKQMGIKVETLSKKGREELAAAAAKIRPQLVGKLYSADFLKKVEGLIAEYRKKN
jgi:TRAP-type C4-dicarboxylate transport system substrate-binding protein